MLELTFLGTGTSQGVPMIGCDCPVCRSSDKHDKRLRTSALVSDGDTTLIIDSGPDFRYQMLRENVKHIDGILLTHEHKDHIAGLDDVRAFNYFEGGSVPVYCTRRVAEVVRKDFDYAFCEFKYPGVPAIDLREIDTGNSFRVGSLEVTPINGLHHRLPVVGFRIGKVGYITDFNFISDDEICKLKGVEVFVINALQHQEHLSHYTVQGAIEVSRAVGAAKTLFTHMSHRIGLYADIKDSLPDGMEFAYDRLKVVTE